MPRGLKNGCRMRRYRACSGGSAATGTSGSGLPTASKARFEENRSGRLSANSAAAADVSMYPPGHIGTTGPASRSMAYAAVRSSATGSWFSRRGAAPGSAGAAAGSPMTLPMRQCYRYYQC